MNIIAFLLTFVLCPLLIFQTIVDGNIWMFSKKKDFELPQRIELLNKHAVKSIRDSNGHLFDCVDFYKQLAFDHPELKDHKLEHRSNPIDYTKDALFSNQIAPKGDECPMGTIRINRITKNNLSGEKYAAENPDSRYAVARTKPGPDRYTGVGGFLTVYKPKVIATQYSAARLLLKNGGDSIEVGWRVDPKLFNDDLCHFYIRSVINTTVCFGVRCPGFVITNPQSDVEANLTSVISTRGGQVYVYRFDITRDVDGNWVVSGGPNGTVIGHWPHDIFTETGLTHLATYAEWGGEVSNPKGSFKPGMGNGFIPVGNASLDCLYYNMTLITDTGSLIAADNVETFANSEMYKIIDIGNPDPSVGHAIVFGGPFKGT